MFRNSKENRVLISIHTNFAIKGACLLYLSALPNLETHHLVHRAIKGNIIKEC